MGWRDERGVRLFTATDTIRVAGGVQHKSFRLSRRSRVRQPLNMHGALDALIAQPLLIPPNFSLNGRPIFTPWFYENDVEYFAQQSRSFCRCVVVFVFKRAFDIQKITCRYRSEDRAP